MTSATDPSLTTADKDPGAARAANLLLITGILEILGFGVLSLSCLMLAKTPMDELQAQLKLPLEEIAKVRDAALPGAIAMGLMGIVPGLTHVVLSFRVRASRYIATQIALLLVATQLIVFGMLFLACALVAVTQANPAALTLNVVTFGSLLMLLGFTFRYLLQARVGAMLNLRGDREPWDSPDE